MSYTDEQLEYITYNKKKHTKLLACAGAGKTRCIIARISFLLEKKIYNQDEIIMLTFSRFTRDDFMNKIRNYSSKGDECISPTSVQTIDSFAKKIIDPDNMIDVSLLSYHLMLFLENMSSEELSKNNILKRIRTVFIDEAQDLNEIQYRIFCQMKEKLNIIINMVGDPNQNIYQFRNSSDKFLTEFDAKIFQLTKNFRSHKSVVEFSKHLRPFAEKDVICSKGENYEQPMMMFYESESVLEEYIVLILNKAKEEGIDLSEFAILSPTRGRMMGSGKSHGLCFVSNVLFKAGIKFKQFYEETVDEATIEGIKYEPQEGHVNVLTFMGSKGLEWNYVLLIDADSCLINKRHFDINKHNYDRYLLYVACSRAVHNMFIFSGCFFRNGKTHFKTNKWFEKVPNDLYEIEERFEKRFRWSDLKFTDIREKVTSLGQVIDSLDCYDLDEISKIIRYSETKPVTKKKIFKNDYTDIDKKSGSFLSYYVSNLFHSLMSMNNKSIMVGDRFSEIKSIVNSDTMITNAPGGVSYWYRVNRKGMTWDKFDKLCKIENGIDDNVKNFILHGFSRKNKFEEHTIATNGYYELFILGQKSWISNLYKKYLKCKNSAQLRDILFYLTVITHSINTNHYFHIKSKGESYKSILKDFNELFGELEIYIKKMEHDFVQSSVQISRWELISFIDLIDANDHIWTTKCTSDITLKNIINSIVLNLMHEVDLITDDFVINDVATFRDINTMSDLDNSSKIKTNDHDNKNIKIQIFDKKVRIRTSFINFLKGDELEYDYYLSSDDIRRIMTILVNNMGKDIKNDSKEDDQIENTKVIKTKK